MALWKNVKLGLKLTLVSILAWILIQLGTLGMVLFGTYLNNPIVWIVMLLIVLPFAFFTMGWVAKKLFKWK